MDGNINDEVYDDWKIKNKVKEEEIREKVKDLDVEIDRFDDVNSIDGWMDGWIWWKMSYIRIGV